jgi:hypothetical protein
MAALHLEYVAPGVYEGTGDYFSFVTGSPHDAIAIVGYTYALRLSYWNSSDSLRIGDDYLLHWTADSSSLEVTRAGRVAVTIPLRAVADSGRAYKQSHGGIVIPQELMRVEARDSTASALLYLTMLGGHAHPGGARLTSLAGTLFLRVK